VKLLLLNTGSLALGDLRIEDHEIVGLTNATVVLVGIIASFLSLGRRGTEHVVMEEMSNRLVEVAGDSAKGGFTLFLGNFSSTAFLVLASIIVARLLGSGDYGLYFLVLVAPSFLASLVGFGLDSAAVMFTSKYLAEGRGGHAASVLKTTLFFRLAIGFNCFRNLLRRLRRSGSNPAQQAGPRLLLQGLQHPHPLPSLLQPRLQSFHRPGLSRMGLYG